MSTRAALLSVSILMLAAAPQSASAFGFSLGSLYSCDAAGSRNTAGTVVGGVLGGIVGAKIAGNDAVGAVIGAGVGSALGNNIGCRMDRKASVDAQTAFQRALDTGKPQSWSDPANGIKGKIEVVGPGGGAGGAPNGGSTGPWRYASGVEQVTRTSDRGGDYTANGRINLRAAPSTSAPVMGRFDPGAPMRVAGVVSGGWYAVERGGEIQGYVSPSVVRPAGGGRSADCRRVRQTINERGQRPYVEEYDACRDNGGSWQLTKT